MGFVTKHFPSLTNCTVVYQRVSCSELPCAVLEGARDLQQMDRRAKRSVLHVRGPKCFDSCFTRWRHLVARQKLDSICRIRSVFRILAQFTTALA